ncbi:MAG: hypothetical protein RLZZ500_64 [Bacteroidota bacterium]|jgi:murein L,D-transpeptidase YcbB/YkuD
MKTGFLWLLSLPLLLLIVLGTPHHAKQRVIAATPIDSTLPLFHKNPLLKEFYRLTQYTVQWNDTLLRQEFLTHLEHAEEEGLQPKDYDYDALVQLEQNYAQLSDSLKIDYDIRLSRSALRWLRHLSDGKLNPYLIYEDWDLRRSPTQVAPLLFQAIENHALSATIEACKPQHPVYQKLKRSLKILRSYPDKFIGLVNLKEKILPNQKSKYIPIIKKRLMYWGDMPEKDSILNQTYDLKTQKAMVRFQKRHGLRPDGIIARATIDALNYSRDQRIEQVIVNMERWRWYPRELGYHYLLVNIPAYNIVAVKDQDTLQYQRVVVGRDTRPTPILSSKISNINLNPNWTVPPTILKEDLFPEAEKNPYHFRKKGLQILDKDNQEVDPKLWKKEDAFRYKYVQNPGRNNSLGLMKINFPNRYTVYLHDTNHRDYFSLSYRSLSSGCVRLQKPLEMAEHILNDSILWPLQKIKDTTDISHYKKIREMKLAQLNVQQAKLKKKYPNRVFAPIDLPKAELKTILIRVKEDISIHQWYWTAWEEKGVLQFREDIYCLDASLYTLLRYK